MTQVLSVSATTAAYAMEAARPTRRVATKDYVRDIKRDSEVNEGKRDSTDQAPTATIIPSVKLSLEPQFQQRDDQHQCVEEVRRAYSET